MDAWAQCIPDFVGFDSFSMSWTGARGLRKLCVTLLLLLLLLVPLGGVARVVDGRSAFVPGARRSSSSSTFTTTFYPGPAQGPSFFCSSSSLHRYANLVQDDSSSSSSSMQSHGERIIREAVLQAGARADQLVSIAWKTSGKIVVTVHGSTCMLGGVEDEQVQQQRNEPYQEEKDLESESTTTTQAETTTTSTGTASTTDDSSPPVVVKVVDVVAIARAINAALDAAGEGSIGHAIAAQHEIEVTTPGASDELSGTTMFEAYRGFPVVLEYRDSKTKKRNTVEGKLVERTEDCTKLNLKGRMRTFRNDVVVSVKLPKAKKEKGAR